MEQIGTVRNPVIDYIRGFAMIQVIFVHILYWTGLFESGIISIIKSFFLFEMPLFFFVTGALFRNKEIADPGRWILCRLSRVLIPYWIYAFFNIGCIVVKSLLRATFTVPYILKAILSWIIPTNQNSSSFPFATGALWFMPVYIICIILLPFMKKLLRGGIVVLLPMIILIPVFQLLGLEILQEVSFYLIWVFLGFYYDTIREELISKSKKYLLLIGIAGGILIILSLCGFTMNMQENKFPPNITFLVFSVGAVTLVLKLIFCCSDRIGRLHKNRVLRFFLYEYEVHSLSIFLYQPVVFWILTAVYNRLRTFVGGSDSIYFCLYFFTAIPLCAVTGKVFSVFEKITIPKIKATIHK